MEAGGAEKQAALLANALKKKFHDVAIILIQKKGINLSYLAEKK